MSYNILKKNVRFSGDSAGTIEGMVDTSSDQVISGSKEFEFLTGSNVRVTSDLTIDGNTLSQTITASTGLSSSFCELGEIRSKEYFILGPWTYNDPIIVAGKIGGVVLFVSGNTDLDGTLNVQGLSTFTSAQATTLTASTHVSASAYYGDGSNLTNIGEAGSVAASNIVGSVIATQISHSSPLTASGGNLTVRLNNSRGIVNDAGLALDIGQFGSTTNFSDSHVILVSGSAISNKKMTIGTLETKLSVNLTNSVGTLPNGQLPSAISVTTLSASSFVSASSFANSGGTLISAEGNFQGNNASFNEITASSVISSSAEISASSFHGDGSGLTGIQANNYVEYSSYFNGNIASTSTAYFGWTGYQTPSNLNFPFIQRKKMIYDGTIKSVVLGGEYSGGGSTGPDFEVAFLLQQSSGINDFIQIGEATGSYLEFGSTNYFTGSVTSPSSGSFGFTAEDVVLLKITSLTEGGVSDRISRPVITVTVQYT